MKCSNGNSSLSPLELSTSISNSLTGNKVLLDPQIVGRDTFARGVSFRDVEGKVYYQQFNSMEISTFSSLSVLNNSFSSILTQNYQVSNQGALVAQLLTSSQNVETPVLLGLSPDTSLVPFYFLGSSATDFSWGRNTAYTWSCIVGGGNSAKCYFNDSFGVFNPSYFTSLVSISEISIAPSLDLTAGLYISSELNGSTQVNGVVKFLGFPFCYNGSFSGSCSFLSPPLIENIPAGLQSVTEVALGNWGACALQGGSLSCWGYFPSVFPSQNVQWSTYESITHVSMYAGGGCVEYISDGKRMGDCWGPLSLSVNHVIFETPIVNYSVTSPAFLSCSSSYDILYNNLCFPCASGFFLQTLSSTQFLTCLPCSSPTTLPSARGTADTQCVLCGLGSQTSLDGSSCVPCSSNSIRTVLSGGQTQTLCVECSPGFVASSDRQSCEPCGSVLVRKQGDLICSACPPGSLGSSDHSRCLSCPQPQILLTTTSPPICQVCPNGQHAVQGFCAPCLPPTYRSQAMLECSSCPPGFQQSADAQSCESCTPNTIRKDTSLCSSCPPGFSASVDRTECLDNHKFSQDPILSLGKTLAISTGLLVFCLCALLTSLKKITPAQGILGYFLGCLFMGGAFLI